MMTTSEIPFTVVEQPTNPPVSRYLSPLAFDNRFTVVERATIDLASLDDPTATQEDRLNIAQIRVWLQRATKAKYIDTSRTDTREGVMFLELLGLIAEGRALEILDAPVLENELYRGE